MKILVIENDPKIIAVLKQGLEEQGHQVEIAGDGVIGKASIENTHFDVLLMDILMPEVNGIEFCKFSKENYPDVPVIILSTPASLERKLELFDSGADDFLVKPFEFSELLARIKVLTRRKEFISASQKILQGGDLELDLEKKVARRNGHEIFLSAKEFSLLEYLIRHKGRVVSRKELAEKIWGITFDTGTNVLDVYIYILRKKIEREGLPRLIRTRIGMGYMFHEDPDW